MEITKAKKVMGKNFIGPLELEKISSRLGIISPIKIKLPIPKIDFSEQRLKKIRKNYILILGAPAAKDGDKFTLNKMRSRFGLDQKKSEPCFYNQDWYLKEKFAAKTHLKLGWYLIGKKVGPETRGQEPNKIVGKLADGMSLPSAILTAYTFFAYYFLNQGEILWKHDFIWCSDRDKNGDRIYTSRYIDPKKINKNGFNVHRHLSLRSCYGAVRQILK